MNNDPISDEVEALLINIAQILDVVKGEWAESWSTFDQEQRDHITKLLAVKRPYEKVQSSPLPKCMSKTTKQDWIDAGNADKEIDLDDVEKRVGKIPDHIRGWEAVCRYVFDKLTGKPMPHCSYMGAGRRSRWHGEQVANTW